MRDRQLQALAAITVLAGVLRFATLDVQSFWLDEAVTVGLVHKSFGAMLGAIPDSESTPPLYYMLAWAWAKLFGSGEVGLRSLSALFGTATIPVAYAAARQLVSRRAGLVVAALAAANPLLFYYSQEARSYALLVLLAGVAFYVFARLLREPSRRLLLWWAIASALALATHYYAAFMFIPEAVWLLVVLRERLRTSLAVGCVAAVGVALLPVGLHQQGLNLAAFITDTSLGERLLQLPKQLLIGYQGPLEVALGAAAMALAVLGVALLLLRGDRDERRGGWIAAVVGVSAVLVPLALVVVDLDYFDTRNLIAAWLPLGVVVGAGLGARRAGRVGVAAAAVLCAIGLVTVVGVAVDPSYQREDWRGVAAALGPAPPGGRAIVVTPATGRVPLAAYLGDAKPVPPARGLVREVAMVVVSAPETGGGSIAKPPRPVAPRHPIPGLVEVRRVYAETFSVIVFRNVNRFPIGPGRTFGSTLGGTGGGAMLIQSRAR